MSLTETEKHWLWGCAVATAASRSDVNVAMPHLRGKWSPINAILRTLEVSFMRHSFHSSACVSTAPPRAVDGSMPGSLPHSREYRDRFATGRLAARAAAECYTRH